MNGTLYIVATPIGNLRDLTERARETLSSVDVVVCEDTRVGGKLLHHLALKKPLMSVHERSDEAHLQDVITELKKGKNVAYISDAGTPNMNDPGGKLVERATEAGIPVVPIPGASALTAAISVCGFPMNVFRYLGFLPKKGLRNVFAQIASDETSCAFLESPHRIHKTLDGLAEVIGGARNVFIGRELTKMHETLYRGTIAEVKAALGKTSGKGEYIVIVGPSRT